MKEPARKPVKGKYGIVFRHHKTDEVTRNNLESFRRWNPKATIVTMSAEEPFPDGYTIQTYPRFAKFYNDFLKPNNAASSFGDLLLYAWYLHRKEQCARWLVVEWDAYCAMPVEQFDAPVAKFPLVAPSIRLPNREPEWAWFQQAKTLPEELQNFQVGIVPFCFVLMDDIVLDKVCKCVPWHELGNSSAELRFGTLASSLGYPPVAHPLCGSNITWIPHPEKTPLTRGMWHPIKWLAD